MQEQEYEQLEQTLLAIGGTRIVPLKDYDEAAEQYVVVFDPYLAEIVKHGVLWDSQPCELVPAAPNACHDNSRTFAATWPERFRWITGFGVSDDGLWRRHSWVYDTARNTLLETTEERVAYFGVEVTDTIDAEEVRRAKELLARVQAMEAA